MKRRLFKLAIFVLLGAIVNVAVAWGCVWGGSHQPLTAHRPTEDDTRWWYAHVPDDFPISPREVLETHKFGVSGTIMFERLGSQRSSHSMVRRRRAGLPMRALEGSTWVDHTKWPVRKIEGQHLMRVLNDQQSLPFYPLLPGFTINTIFYAVILWLITLGPFTARRFIRRKRGRCIKCGYDLRGAEHDVCPECGVEV